ncbi:hypothetical protein SAMN05443637_111133 [Pseudonocardia thermophila]|uniref:Nitroreductase family protein n=1 Tax=Pseudonocardia thermophila TaxID=1848 RepID=A0A1M6V131_PSETH|nr:hypothetical protein [Pseudonocardia thermophila]SHK75163.1 hypothetical protein SAMN05443637_111133 [Pseudonocardia thermophila]
MNLPRTTAAVGRGSIRTAAELAGRAPSLHNTQPWRLHWTGRTLQLWADRTRQLPGTDPEGRGLLLSCGAALHHLRAALAALDVGTLVDRFPDPTEPDHVATLHLHPDAADPALAELAGAISARHTDRRRFTEHPITEADVEALRLAAAGEGALLVTLSAPHAHQELLAAMAEANRLAAHDPEIAAETELWSGAFAGDDGVPPDAVPRDPAGVIGGVRYSPGTLAQPPDPSDGASLLLLVTNADDARSRLRAGEALSSALLRATTRGLACAPLTQVLEYPQTRRAVAKRVLADPAVHPQVVLRIGWPRSGAAALVPTPRRPVDDYLDEVPDPGEPEPGPSSVP